MAALSGADYSFLQVSAQAVPEVSGQGMAHNLEVNFYKIALLAKRTPPWSCRTMPPRPRTRWSMPWRILRSCRRQGVRTNGDTPKEDTVAYNFNAEGVDLCRNGYMFFEATAAARGAR